MRAAAKFWSGNFVVGNEYMNKCYGVYDPIKHRPNIMIYGQDSGVCVLANGGWLDWFMGYPDLARQTCLKGISLAEGIGHDFSLCFALSFLNYLYIYLGEPDALGESSERLARVARASDIKAYGLNAVVHRGWYAVMQGNYDEGMNAFQQALKTYEIVGSLLHIPLLMNLIAETYLRMDKIEEGLKTTESAFERLSSIETRAFMPELHRIRGELLLKSPTHTRTEGIAALEKALNMAQDMSAKSLELRAAMSLYRAQGETAHPLLASVYNWFTEGLDTTDLVAARTLLTNGKT